LSKQSAPFYFAEGIPSEQFFSAESGSAIDDSVKQRAHRHILPV
jgi:hypothetical protein